jgi:TonB family protein
VFIGGVLAFLLFHGTVVMPVLLSPILDKPDVPLVVEYAPEEPNKTPDKPKPPEVVEAPKDKEKRKKDKEKEKPPELAKTEEPQPEPEKPKPEPVQPVQPPPPPPPTKRERMQMVDQEKFPDEDTNNDARYLAQRNHRTQQDTSAKNTNLVREVETEAKTQTEENKNKADEVGGKDHKIAELESRQGPDNSMPRSAPKVGEEGQRTEQEQTKRGPLSMRDLVQRSAAVDEKRIDKRDGVEVQEPDPGELPMARAGRDAASAHAQQKGGNIKLRLDHHDYDRIEGYDTAEHERHQATRAEASMPKGRYDRYLKKLQAMRSSIENFTFDVKPGNQAELGTRKDPFAGYITAMHRQIHKIFTFGFLQDIEMRAQKTQYDDMTLWTQLQIVINGDGTVEKVGIVRTSGVLAFDVAAIDSIMSAAPFPKPPAVIKSANGKVYMDWQFHRDERACGTFGVDPYILTTPGDQPHDTSETGGDKAMYERAHANGKPGAPQKQAKAKTQTQSVGDEVTGTSPARPMPEKRGNSDGEDSAAPPQRSLSRLERPKAEVVIAPTNVPEVTEEATKAAEGWFAAWARGSVDEAEKWLVGWSAVPFQANGHVVARDGAALHKIYKQLFDEVAPGTKLAAPKLLTPAGIRGRLGGLPPGGRDSGMIYAVGKLGSDEVILLLTQSSKGWRVSGMAR